jgi:hypothetical protein
MKCGEARCEGGSRSPQRDGKHNRGSAAQLPRHLSIAPRPSVEFHPPLVNKAALVEKIIAQLAAEMEGYARSARAAHAEATDEQSKAENKYDTRGLEASYLARGQSRQAAETAEALEQFAALPLRDFSPADPIDLSALVELETATGKTCYFIGPRSGGMEVKHGKREILVITPQSPLGQQLVGKKQGDQWETQLAGKRSKYRVASVA